MNGIKYCGAIDIDDRNFNIALINQETGELIHFKTITTVGSIIKKLKAQKIPLKSISI